MHSHIMKLCQKCAKNDLIFLIEKILLNLLTLKRLAYTYGSVRLSDDVTRDQLEGIRPDTAKLPSLETSGHVSGVIVTIRLVSYDMLIIWSGAS
jgi:hypothetical protein